jgi:hypothetical protein
MNLSKPLVSKNPDGVLRVVLPGRISQPSQDEESIDSQHLDAEGWLLRVHKDKPVKLTPLGEQASGWLADRATMLQAMAIIEAGECDLVLVGELREIYRNPGFQWKFVYDCLDNDTRFIAVHDCIDTTEESWEVMMHAAALRHGLEVPTTRRRVRRKATYSFSKGGMVAKIKFGYARLSREEAASGKFGPVGLRIAKLGKWTPLILEMRRRILAGITAEAVSDWLIAEGIDPGPYAERWSGRLVLDLLTDPILSGQRRFRRTISKMIYRTGKHKTRPNPEAPQEEVYTELAHMTKEEQQDLLDYLAARRGPNRAAQKCGRKSPLWNVPRSRSIWPGQSARCPACYGLMYRYGVYLKCQNAVPGGPKTCWNHVLVEIDMVHKKVIPAVIRFLDRAPRARTEIAVIAWMQYQRDCRQRQRSTGDLDAVIVDLMEQEKNLSAAIAKRGGLDSLLELLANVQDRLKSTRAERERLTNRKTDLGAYQSAKAIEDRFAEVVPRMAAASREFADLLRRLITRFMIHPVQALDTPQVRPRAELTMSTAAWTPSGEQPLEEVVTIDLFEPPAHIRFLDKCLQAAQEHPEATLREIAQIVGIGYMTVKRARDYVQLMKQAEASDPYRVLTSPPSDASRWRSRRQGAAGQPRSDTDPT